MAYIKLFETIVTIFVLMGVGIFSVRRGILCQKDTQTFTNFIFNITSPALILISITGYFTKDNVLSSAVIPAFAILMTLISLGIAYCMGKILKIRDKSRQDIFSLTVSFCNTVYIGLPIIMSVYGERAAGYVFFYDLGSSLVLWTIGVELAGRDNGVRTLAVELAGRDVSAKKNFNKALKNLANPPLIALTIAITLVMTGVKIPSIISAPLKMLGDITIPLSMLFIGMSVADIHISSEIFEPMTVLAILIRLIISPLIIGILVYFTGIPIILKKVITIEAGMPIMMFTAILAKKYEKHPEFAAKVVMLTTMLSMITIPIIVLILENIY